MVAWLILWAAFFGAGVAKESWLMMGVSGSMGLIAIAEIWFRHKKKGRRQ